MYLLTRSFKNKWIPQKVYFTWGVHHHIWNLCWHNALSFSSCICW